MMSCFFSTGCRMGGLRMCGKIACTSSRQFLARGSCSGALLLLVVGSLGCAVLLPAHPNSNDREGEKVSIEMLTLADVYSDEKVKDLWERRFKMALPRRPPEAYVVAPPAAAIASALVGLAIDKAGKELRREASQYEAQYSATQAVDGFWLAKGLYTSLAALSQNYYAFRVTRKTNKYQPAFQLYVGIAPSLDHRMFLLAPLLVEMSSSKAKVLSDTWSSWLPPMLFGKLARSPGHEVRVAVSLEIEGYFADKSQKLNVVRLAAVEWQLGGFDISKDSSIELPEPSPSAWIVGVPVSVDEKGKPIGRGQFTLRAAVTESDSSNAKNFLEESAALLSKNKEGIVKKVGEGLQ